MLRLLLDRYAEGGAASGGSGGRGAGLGFGGGLAGEKGVGMMACGAPPVC